MTKSDYYLENFDADDRAEDKIPHSEYRCVRSALLSSARINIDDNDNRLSISGCAKCTRGLGRGA